MTPATPTRSRSGQLSDRTRRAYASDWALFTDWCTATSRRPLPATPDVLAVFLRANPAAPATQTRRLAAITHHHTQAGLAAPGHDPAVATALLAGRDDNTSPNVGDGQRTSERENGGQYRTSAAPRQSTVEAALRMIPSHGWPAGLFGRRDQCLLVLSQLGGLTHRQLRDLTTAHVEVDQHGLTVRLRGTIGAGGRRHIPTSPDPAVCPGCIYLRWHAVLATATRVPSVRPLRQALFQAGRVTPDSPHRCQRTHSPLTPAVPLLQAADQHGYLTEHRSLSRRAISAVVAASMIGQPPSHRSMAALHQPAHHDTEDHDEPTTAATKDQRTPSEMRAQHAAGVARRQHDRTQLDDVDDILRRLDDDIDALLQRTKSLLRPK